MKKILFICLMALFGLKAAAQTTSQVIIIDTTTEEFKRCANIFRAMMIIPTKSLLVLRNDTIYVASISPAGDTVWNYRFNLVRYKVDTTKFLKTDTAYKYWVRKDSAALQFAPLSSVVTNNSQILNGSNFITLASVMTGYSAAAGTPAATDNLIQFLNKVVGNINTVTTTANNAMPKSGGTFTGTITVPTIKYGRRTVADANITLAATDYLVCLTSITASRTITLPTASACTNQFFIIKDESGGLTSLITVTVSGTVDGVTNPVALNLTQRIFRLYSNGTGFYSW